MFTEDAKDRETRNMPAGGAGLGNEAARQQSAAKLPLRERVETECLAAECLRREANDVRNRAHARARQMLELNTLLTKHPDVARIFELLEVLNEA